MRKTSLYLDDADDARLDRLAEQEGRSRADIIRTAIAEYERAHRPERTFLVEGSWQGDGTSIADVSEEEMLRGFGNS